MQFIFPVDDPVAAVEILYNNEFMATVYEKPDGWKIDLYQSPRGLDLDEFLRFVDAAKERLGEYTNRRGENPPEGLTAAGLSLWLTEKADGTTLADRMGKSAT